MRTLSVSAACMLLALSGGLAPAPALAQTTQTQAPVDDRAMAALDRMSAYLSGLSVFEVTSNATQDLVLEDGHTIKLGLYARYVVHAPRGLYAEVHTDRQHRNFYFDGADLTVTAPRLGYYATASARGSLGELVDTLADQYGIDLPLADLFLWHAREHRVEPTLATVIGYADVGGRETDQYLFVGPAAEWQVWVQRGEQPLPLRIVVTDTTDPARPQFAADLVWDLSPDVAASQFTFTPPGAAQRIVFGELSEAESE